MLPQVAPRSSALVTPKGFLTHHPLTVEDSTSTLGPKNGGSGERSDQFAGSDMYMIFLTGASVMQRLNDTSDCSEKVHYVLEIENRLRLG